MVTTVLTDLLTGTGELEQNVIIIDGNRLWISDLEETEKLWRYKENNIYCILIEFMVVSKVYFIIYNFLLPQKNYTQKKVHTRIALKYMKRNMFGKHRLLEIQPLADYLYFPCRIQMRRRSLQRQIQMDSTQIHKQEWMFSDRNALRKVWPLANSSTLYTSPPAYKYISCILIQNTISSKGKLALY